MDKVKKFVPAHTAGGMVAVVSNDYSHTYVAWPDYDILRQQLAAALAERDRAVKDAERWQKLCDLSEQDETTLPAIMVDAFHMGSGCIELHVDAAMADAAIAPGGHDWRTDGGGIDYCSRCGKGKKSVANRPCAADKGVDAAGGAHE